MQGIIQVVDSAGNVAFLSPSLRSVSSTLRRRYWSLIVVRLQSGGKFTAISARSGALPVSLPSTCPAGVFPIYSSLTEGYIGASVEQKMKRAKRQLPTPLAAGTAAAVQAAADLAYKNIVAAQLAAAIGEYSSSF